MAYTTSQLAEWMADAGFRRVASYDFLENAFFVVFAKQASAG